MANEEAQALQDQAICFIPGTLVALQNVFCRQTRKLFQRK